jgi:RND superfamily putative drug exporter
MRVLATWCFRRRRLVLALWLGALIMASAVSHAVGTTYSNAFTLPNTPSTAAINLLKSVSPSVSGDTEQVVIQTSGGIHVNDPAVQARVDSALARISRLPHATDIVSPYGPGGADRVSASRTVAFATVTFDRQSQDLPHSEAKTFVAAATSAAGPGIRVAVSGQLGEESNRQSFGGSGLGIILAAVVLLLVFGSAFAMALPLLSALVSLGTAIGLIGLLSHLVKMPQFSSELVLLIGLGVGVDYALFIVTRHRQGLIAGQSTESAAVNAVNTSGRAVLLAGIVVCIALLGMFALGVSFLYGLAVSAAIGVALTMISALTLLPAMLGFIGPRIMSRRQKRSLAQDGPRIVGAGARGFWPRWANLVQSRPMLPAVGAVAVIAVLVIPFSSLRLGSSDQGNDPVGTTTRAAYDMLATGFGPGFNGPLQLVLVSRAGAGGARDTTLLARLTFGVAAQPDVARVAPAVTLPPKDGRLVRLIDVYPGSAPQDAATTDLITRLRSQTVPRVVAGTALTVYVSGDTAVFVDFSHVLSAKLPLFVGLVVLLSFVLLAVVFRSLAIPLTGAVMNLLSIGAAFGILVAVFQWGWLGGVFQVSRAGPIEAFLPVMLFSILFGLSTDYQVFLVSRIHEEWLKTGDNRQAVRNGLAATGKTITAAALIMILVFGSFILGGERVIKEFGLGLAGGILVDAVVIRMTIVPAVMLLIGRANWWFPRSLRVLPKIAVEPDVSAPAPPTVRA